ncbi:MAG: phasin family protein [Pseudomonadota bacterium]
MSKSKEPASTSQLAPEKIFRTLTHAQTSGLGSLSWLGSKWVETMSDVGAEWLSFVAERVKEDVKTQHALLHAKNIGEVQHIQAQFLQKAMDDYRDETGKIVEFCSQTMSDIQNYAAKQDEAPANKKAPPKT